jgi:5-methyltetrahydrofolate--homocysteine methyltransferase
MALKDLSIIGESINDSVPSTHKLFEQNDINGLKELAKLQDNKGAAYIDVNVGSNSPEFMAEMIKIIQDVTSKPLAIDSPDFDTAKAGLEAYDIQKAAGNIPVLNSIAQSRTEMFELLKKYKFMPILMVSEKEENGSVTQNYTAEETYETAKRMLSKAKQYANITNDEIIIDVGIAPIASDMQGMTKRTIDSIVKINSDEMFKGIHMSVGLSNFTVMLPPKTKDGLPIKSALESAFLTITMKHGLDMVIGSVKRKYKILENDHPAMICLKEVLQLDGLEVLMRVQKFYS